MIETIGTEAVMLVPVEGAPIASGEDGATLIGDAFSEAASVVAIPVARLSPAFLDLSTRIAGDVLQKFVNYGIRVAIVGDIGPWLEKSEALRAFVVESNRGRSVWFVADLEALRARLE